MVTALPKDQRRAAVKCLEPLLKVVDRKNVWVVRGPGFHDGLAGMDAVAIGETIGAREWEDGQSAGWVLWLEHQGKLFHFTHHINPSSVYPQTPMMRQMTEAKINFVDNGFPIPDVQVRSHVHNFNVATDGEGRWLFTTPCFQLRSEYSVKKIPMSVPDIGALMLWVEGDEIRWQSVRYPLAKPKINR